MSDGEPGARAEDTRGKGDAVWVVPRTELVPEAPEVSFGDLVPLKKQLKTAAAALKSFATPVPREVRRKAAEDARRILEADPDAQVA